MSVFLHWFDPRDLGYLDNIRPVDPDKIRRIQYAFIEAHGLLLEKHFLHGEDLYVVVISLDIMNIADGYDTNVTRFFDDDPVSFLRLSYLLYYARNVSFLFVTLAQGQPFLHGFVEAFLLKGLRR